MRYRVTGTADRFKDRGKLFSHGESTIFATATTKERAIELAEIFVQGHPPAGPDAYVTVEEIHRDGGSRTLSYRAGTLHGWKDR